MTVLTATADRYKDPPGLVHTPSRRSTNDHRVRLELGEKAFYRLVHQSSGFSTPKMLRHIRKSLEKFMDHRVHLELWVKVDPTWFKKRKRVSSLGYR